MASALTSKFAKFSPFSRKEDDEDKGEEIDYTSVAGGGHGGRQSAITKNKLRASHALRSFLVDENVLSEEEAGLDDDDTVTPAVRALLDKPHVIVPPQVVDRSYPLPEYFISSSHNTYLMAHQLYGSSSADAYKVALNAGARCVEIDAWDNDDNKDEPKVTHGYTLVSHIPFRKVCETIRDVVDKEAADSVDQQGYRAAPILISLENHCSAEGQQALVNIMKEVLGERLLSKAVREEGHREQEGSDENVSLHELGSKVALIVEFHLPDEKAKIAEEEEEQEEDAEGEPEDEREARKAYDEKVKETATSIIIPELAALGVYAQSVKPVDNSWFEEVQMKNGPRHHLINVSESGLASLMPTHSAKISLHNARHLMRVYPKGTRISSSNINPVLHWGVGAQIAALNWQTFGASMQINEALFSGSEGYVLKPAALRAGGDGKLSTGMQKRLRLHVAGATDVPVPAGGEPKDIKPYVTCTLVHPDNLDAEPPKRKTSPYKQHKLGFLHSGENPPQTDPVWDEHLEWEYEDNDLAFLRILIKSDDSFARNPILTAGAVRLMYVNSGWSFIRMLDLKGGETQCSLLVKFDIEYL
ncbi:putative 1-phosphatidylinositol-4,5-bisphosphate phosphodiesterase 1 [Rhizodiscina lignyota]|uniref:Phosphoinositide phospholipase C n=1 Tax=Rhizodiscina lignyota TaxID=1504668 RepID=A0A9P4IFT4_9PEZI|nr:putative 1-phosphatidylinositol-4,5-bisphosphate phosphodiesterase 1 [Rhizodiscina lignyota]